MRQRVAYLIIDGKKFGDTDHSLEIRFDITYAGNSRVPLDTTFYVYNLKKDDIYKATKNTSLFEDKMVDIEFWCGYKGNVRRLFKGKILNASPSGQPDTSLTISALADDVFFERKVKVNYKNITFYDLLKDYEAKSGCPVIIPESIKYDSRLQTVVGNYAFTGSVSEYITKIIKDITGNNITKGNLVFVRNDGIIYVANQDTASRTIPPIPINSKTGMVGIPEPTETGINVRVLLDTTLRAGLTINLTSTMLPKYDGTYNIINVTHHGSVRGKEFYTDMYCTKAKRG